MSEDQPMTPEHLAQLRRAKSLLQNPSFAAKLSNLVGRPIEKGIELLPADWSKKIGSITADALQISLKGALLTMKSTGSEASPWWHKAAAMASGASGGFFGLPALAFELPASTTIMCRSIADIARSHGESLDESEAKLACLEVFAFGGRSSSDDGSDTGYFATRAALARAVSEATGYLASHKLADEGAPALVRLIALIAARFQLQVTEKAAAQAVPVVGAAAGALINLMFMDHYQDVSQGHFTVRRLERVYGKDVVRLQYDSF